MSWAPELENKWENPWVLEQQFISEEFRYMEFYAYVRLRQSCPFAHIYTYTPNWYNGIDTILGNVKAF